MINMVVFPIHEEVITMTKIFKRISAVAMAAAMATTMAITASAEPARSSGLTPLSVTCSMATARIPSGREASARALTPM